MKVGETALFLFTLPFVISCQYLHFLYENHWPLMPMMKTAEEGQVGGTVAAPCCYGFAIDLNGLCLGGFVKIFYFKEAVS